MNILQNTFDKHLKLLKEHFQLNEGYSSQEVVKFFNDLSSKLAAKKVNYADFLGIIETIEKTGQYYAEQADNMTNKQLDRDQLMSFKEDAANEGADGIYDYDDEVIGYMISVFITWLHANRDYAEKADSAGNDQDTLSQLDEHPGMSFTNFMHLAKVK